MSTKPALLLLLLSSRSWWLNRHQNQACLFSVLWEQFTAVSSVCSVPNFTKREVIVVVPSLEYHYMGEMAEYLLVALPLHSRSFCHNLILWLILLGGADGALEKRTNSQTKGCQRLKLPNPRFCLEMQTTAVGISFCSYLPGYSLFPAPQQHCFNDWSFLSLFCGWRALVLQRKSRVKKGRLVSCMAGTQVRSCWLQDAGFASGDIEHET